jgi:outer membrane biosynthesis protein TonB
MVISYPSIIRTLPKKLLQPDMVSVLTSIGIHVLVLGVVFPKLSISYQQQNLATQRTVGLMELTPTEQNRLPNSLRSPSATTLDNPPVPDASLFNASALKKPVLPLLKSLPLPPPPEFIPGKDSSITTYFPDLSALPTPLLPNFPLPPVKGAKIEPLASVDAKKEDKFINSPQQIPSESPENTQQEIPAKVDMRVISKPIPFSNSNNDLQPQKDLVVAIRQRGNSLRLDTTNTTPDEANRNYVNWLQAVETEKPEYLSIPGNYPQDACLRKLKGSTQYGVLVNSQGKPIDLHLIQSAGYPILNQQARKDIMSRSFPNQSDRSIPYRVEIEFEFNQKICPSLSVTPVKPPQKQETPILTPEAPQKTPEIIIEVPDSSKGIPEVIPQETEENIQVPEPKF